MASCLVRATPDRSVWVRAQAGHIVVCSWARHFTLTVPLSTQVYKWVPENLMLGRGYLCDGLVSHPGGVKILLFMPCYIIGDLTQNTTATATERHQRNVQ